MTLVSTEHRLVYQQTKVARSAPAAETGGLLPKMAPATPPTPLLGLRGSLHREWKRCGKATCRCAPGRADRAQHGPYFYRSYRVAGLQRRQYVRPADLRVTAAAIARWQAVHPPAWTLRRSLAELRRISQEWDS